MECSFSTPLTEEELLTALDDEAEPHVAEHLEGCPGCTERLDEMRKVEQTLEEQLHPTPDQLGDYHLGLLDNVQQHVIVEHLKLCPLCRSDYESLKSFVNAIDAAADQVSITPERQIPRTRRSTVRHLALQPAQGALRGAARQVAHGDGRLMINLDIRSTGANQVTIQGRLIAVDQPTWTGALLTLRQAGVVRGTAILNDKGIFILEAKANSMELFAMRIDSPNSETIALDDL